MDFSLHYRGDLKSNGDNRHKHDIRIHLHTQLAKIASSRKAAARYIEAAPDSRPGRARLENSRCVGQWDFIWLMVKLQQHQFDVVGKDVQHWVQAFAEVEPSVALDITLFRPGKPGAIMSSGGDIDNRLKTLFDALQPPNPTATKLPEKTPESPDPVICLLEDDGQVSDLRIRTRELFDYERSSEVVLVMDVTATGSALLR